MELPSRLYVNFFFFFLPLVSLAFLPLNYKKKMGGREFVIGNDSRSRLQGYNIGRFHSDRSN